MAIRKKITVLFMAIFLFFLVASYSFMYFYFNNTVTDEAVLKQEAQILTNRHLVSNFMDNIRQTGIQFISDKAIGSQLNSTTTEPMERIRIRASLQTQFSHYALLSISHDVNSYRYTLFLNDMLPIASMFEAKTLITNPYSSSANVFTNTLVREEDWYLKTVSAPNFTYVFHNDQSGEFCIAKKILNTYYTGPTLKYGQAVLVISVKKPYIDSIFSGIPNTKNSGYALMNKEGDFLYTSPNIQDTNLYTKAWETIDQNRSLYPAGKSSRLSIKGESYLVNYDRSDPDISLISLTPFSDISDAVQPVMTRFSLVSLLIALCAISVVFTASDRITRPIIRLSAVIGSITDTRTFHLESLHVSRDREMVILEESFGKLITNTNQLIEDIRDQEIRQKNAELAALQAQIDPHFIFNAMDAVNWIALSRDQDDLANILASIASLMRYSIMETDQLIPISREISNIREYIAIYRLRHQGEILLSIDSEEPLTETMIPKFSLQPLVENSIRYGRQTAGTAIEILITVRKDSGCLILEVSDNGQGCDPDLLNEYLAYQTNNLKVTNGFGIRNVNDRIRLHFGSSSGLKYYINEKKQLTAYVKFILSKE